MQTQIQLRAQQYNTIYQTIRAKSSVESPMNAVEVYTACKNEVRNLQQVRDALDSMTKASPKLVNKIREGRIVRYWANEAAPDTRPVKQKKVGTAQPKKVKLTTDQKVINELPEIIIEKHRITIVHPNWRVIILN